MRARLLLVVFLMVVPLVSHAATDAYVQWATSKWGISVVGSNYAKSTTWGETADPDHDGLPNLLEYACDIDPTRHNLASDCYQFTVPTEGALSSRFPQIHTLLRTDDPDLRITCQTSNDLMSWYPNAPVNFDQPPPVNTYVLSRETGSMFRGLCQMHYIDAQSMDGRRSAFMRLHVSRRGSSVSSFGVDPFTFTSQASVLTGSIARSSAITLSGFAGTVTINIPSGVTLYVNGIAQTGSLATVKAGDTLWMQANAPATAGVPRNYTLSIGSTSATWSFTTTAIAAVPDHPGTDSGYTPVETGVSDTGAAQISIPIVAAPGTAGVQPKLSINYSSQGGNGPLGVGFSLSGLITISRVGRTIAQDGVKGGVAFDSNDRFALDGQRLIAINGADGADGTEYRLEFDPTSRIRSYGNEGGGPQRWVVEAKAGLKMEFGLNANSRIKPEGGTSALAWAIEKITDTAGNSMVFGYNGAARQWGEMLVTSVSYTINEGTGLVANQDVVIQYEGRSDSRTNYVAGFAIKSTLRISSITTRSFVNNGWRVVRSYIPVYKQSSLSGLTLCTGVREEAPGSLAHVTNFSWLDDASGTNLVFTTVPAASLNWHWSTVQPGDFDNNGLSDFIGVDTSNRLVRVLNDPDKTFRILRDPAGSGFDSTKFWLGDFDASGTTDVVALVGTDQLWTFFSEPDGSFSPKLSWSSPVTVGTSVWTCDLNGDGRTDLVTYQQGNPLRTYLSSSIRGEFSLMLADVGPNLDTRYVRPGDFDGDGAMDLISLEQPERWKIWYGDAAGSWSRTRFVNVPTSAVSVPIVADMNGDGISDILLRNSIKDTGYGNFTNDLRTFIFDGASGVSTADTSISPYYWMGWYPNFLGDFNRDGLLDFLSWGGTLPSDYSMTLLLLRTTGTYARGDLINENQSFQWGVPGFIVNSDTDGTADIAVSSFNNLVILRRESSQADTLSTVVNGHGQRTNFNYKPLTDTTVHSKREESYPFSAVSALIPVVERIESTWGGEIDAFSGAVTGPAQTSLVSYRYEGARSCLDGRGFMGFKAIEATDAASGIITRTVFEDRPLYAGRAKRAEQRLLSAPSGGSDLVSESDTTWNLTETTHPTGLKSYFVIENESISKGYEVNQPPASALVRTTTRNGFSYDGYGNLLTSTTSTTAAGQTFTEAVTNTYADAPTPTRWHLGRLATSSVTKTGPNPAGPGTISLTRTSSFAYHPATGLLTREVIEPGGGILRQQKDYTHDGFGNILTSTISTSGATPRTTTTTYTPDGRFVATTTNAANHTESKTYDPLLGNVLTQTGPNGLTTTWEYDAIGRPIKETRPDGMVTRSFYRRVTGSTVGAPPRAVHYVRVQSSGGAPKTVWYDLLDREIRADGIAFDGRTVSFHKIYNNRGEVTHASQPHFAGDTPLYSQMLYDAVGREYQQTDPGNRVTKTTYNGLTTTVERNYNPALPTDFQKAVTVVNAMGWTVQSSQYLGAAAKTITRKYDPYGSLRFVIDSANNTTELRYDLRGNKIWMNEPNSGTSTFSYNGFSELKTQTNNATQTVSLTYDKLGRTLTRTEPEGVTNSEYDTAAQGIGQLARESSGDFVRSYFYDHLSRPANTVESHGFHNFAMSRSYDGYGRPDAMTYPTGLATRQIYTANGHLSEVQNAATMQLYWRAMAVNARGQVTQEVQGNGVVTDRVFDADTGLIDGITSTLGSVGDVQKAEFDFDLIGNLTARRDRRYSTTFNETFGYDTLNRLQTVATTGAAAVTAAYNDLGNITSRTDVGSFSYGAASTGPHALTGVSGGAFNKSCGYDAKGNRVTDGATSLTYSSYNKPVRMVKGSDTLRFDYGTDRALYRQTTFLTDSSGPSPITRQNVREYIGGLYERETTSEGLVRHIHYIAGGSGVTAILTDERGATTTAQRTRYIHKDHLGSVDAITDNSGSVVERQSFDAWGRRRIVAYNIGTSTWSVAYPATPGSAETHRGFTGHEMLDAVGLVHMGGRIYDPITARFLSPDPFVQSPDNLQNLNRYSYVLNNPLSFTDPSGFFFKKLFKSVAKLFVQHVVGSAFAAVGFVIAGPAGATAGYGFGSAFSGTLLAGGSIGDALRAGLVGGISARLTMGIGTAFESKALAPYAALKPIVHGAAQGGIRVAQGGKFTHGFMSGAFASQFADVADMAENSVGSVWAGRAVAAVVGGTAEVIGGGKFGNGAMTGAFIRMFNDEVHRAAIEKRFGITDENRDHEYGDMFRFCSSTESGCSEQNVYDFMKDDPASLAPRWRMSHIADGGEMSSQLYGGLVAHQFDDKNLTYYNITKRPHVFYGGYVERSVLTIGGDVYIRTYGTGTNYFPPLGSANQHFGLKLFQGLNQQVQQDWQNSRR